MLISGNGVVHCPLRSSYHVLLTAKFTRYLRIIISDCNGNIVKISRQTKDIAIIKDAQFG